MNFIRLHYSNFSRRCIGCIDGRFFPSHPQSTSSGGPASWHAPTVLPAVFRRLTIPLPAPAAVSAPRPAAWSALRIVPVAVPVSGPGGTPAADAPARRPKTARAAAPEVPLAPPAAAIRARIRPAAAIPLPAPAALAADAPAKSILHPTRCASRPHDPGAQRLFGKKSVLFPKNPLPNRKVHGILC